MIQIYLSLKNIDALFKRLILSAVKIRRSSLNCNNVIVATEFLECGGKKEIFVLLDSSLKVSTPNIDHFYELHVYKFNYNNDDVTLDNFIYVLAILFR